MGGTALQAGGVRAPRWPVRVVLVPPEDHPSPLAQSLWAFTQRGIDVEVHHDAASALIAVGEGDVAAVIVALKPPGVEIGRFVAAVRQYAGVPVLVGLTGDPDPDAVVKALDAGAHGLIQVPLATAELCDHLRRLGVGGPGKVVTGTRAALQPEASALRLGDRVATLTTQEYRILELLLRHTPNAVTTEVLVEAIGARRAEPAVAVRVAIGRLRRRLSASGIPGDKAIQSQRGVGYRWVEPDVQR